MLGSRQLTVQVGPRPVAELCSFCRRLVRMQATPAGNKKCPDCKNTHTPKDKLL